MTGAPAGMDPTPPAAPDALAPAPARPARRRAVRRDDRGPGWTVRRDRANIASIARDVSKRSGPNTVAAGARAGRVTSFQALQAAEDQR